MVLRLCQGWQVPRLLSNLIWRKPIGSSSAESGDGLGDLNSIKQPSNTQTLVFTWESKPNPEPEPKIQYSDRYENIHESIVINDYKSGNYF